MRKYDARNYDKIVNPNKDTYTLMLASHNKKDDRVNMEKSHVPLTNTLQADRKEKISSSDVIRMKYFVESATKLLTRRVQDGSQKRDKFVIGCKIYAMVCQGTSLVRHLDLHVLYFTFSCNHVTDLVDCSMVLYTEKLSSDGYWFSSV